MPWFPYRLTGAIIRTATAASDIEPWFPYRLTGAIIGAFWDASAIVPWFPYRLTGAIILAAWQTCKRRAVVPLQTHGCYNAQAEGS